MALIHIEYGSVASSELMNNNLQYLDDKIESVSQSLSANTTTLSSNISSLAAKVSDNKSQLETSISNLDSELAGVSSVANNCAQRIYIKETYKNGQNWYRLYSDKWIEQGGFVGLTGTNAKATVTLMKPMADWNASVYVSCLSARTSGEWDIGITGAYFETLSTIRISTGRDAAGGGVYWRVCGYIA